MNGMIFSSSTVRLADDHRRHEQHHALRRAPPRQLPTIAPTRPTYHWWNSGYYTDTMFETYYPLNSQFKGLPFIPGSIDEDWAHDRRQLPPRRGQRRLLRRLGEVHQGHDPVGPLQPDRRQRPGLHLQRRRRPTPSTPGIQLGVWQKLSTRNFGEVVSSDSY